MNVMIFILKKGIDYMFISLSPIIFVVGCLLIFSLIGATVNIPSLLIGSLMTFVFMALDRIAINYHRS